MKDIEIVLKSIKNKEFLPIYFLHGEEPYYIDVATRHFENDVLEEDEKAFNQTVVYGKDTNYGEILSLARQYPMMGEKQLIIVKEAQDLKLEESESDAFLAYLTSPVESTILVFAHKHKKLDSRKKVSKELANKKFLFLSDKIKDSQLASWIQSEIERFGYRSAPNISFLLAEYLGSDLSRISNELNKLKLVLKENDVLNEKIVEEHIGISKDYNIFELQKALATKNKERAFKIAYYMGKNKKTNPIQMSIGALYKFFSDLIMYHTLIGQSPSIIAKEIGVNPYAIQNFAEAARFYPLKMATRIISVIREMDLKSKGLGVRQMEDDEIYVEMTFKILNIDQLKTK
ncbi:DNA polymerase III subunit delta [Soonwooa purpurea]